MSSNSVTSRTRRLEDAKDQSSRKWNNPIWTGIVGLIFLSGAIGSLQRMAESFAGDVEKVVFIANWIPWFAILCFAFGWFMTHWIEVALSQNHRRVAILLVVIVFLTVFLLSAYLHFFSNNDVLYRFENAVLPLVFSGCILRYSVFRRENLLQSQPADK